MPGEGEYEEERVSRMFLFTGNETDVSSAVVGSFPRGVGMVGLLPHDSNTLWETHLESINGGFLTQPGQLTGG